MANRFEASDADRRLTRKQIFAAHVEAVELLDMIRIGVDILYDAPTVDVNESEAVRSKLRELHLLLFGYNDPR